jgi:phthalate 4,5-dioxygenase
MLTAEENELLTQVARGTPMGELLRRYWVPALTAREVREANGDPVRVRLMGESFVAWRDESGVVGFFDEYCMHRGASLALGRAEGDGLRCIYHGWKFSTDGTILETPNCVEPYVPTPEETIQLGGNDGRAALPDFERWPEILAPANVPFTVRG